MIIDSHTHLETFEGKYIKPKQRLLDLKKSMKKAKVGKAIILQDIKAKFPVLSAEQILELIKNEKNLFLVGTISILRHTKKDIKKLDNLIEEKSIIGIKLYPGYESFYPFDKRCDSIYDLCEKYDVPVVFHTGDTLGTYAPIKYSVPIYIDDVACKRPALKIVIAHAGNPWIDDSLVVLGRHENVYADLSGLILGPFNQPLTKYLKQSINKIIAWCEGGHKLLFGTDWPINKDSVKGNLMSEYVKFIKSLEITKKDERKILYMNSQKLFRL